MQSFSSYYLNTSSVFTDVYKSVKLLGAGKVLRHLDRCHCSCQADMTVKVSVRSLTHTLWFLHTHRNTHMHAAIVLTCLWNSTGALLSSSLLSSLPPHFTPLFISFFPSSSTEVREDLSLTTSCCKMTDDSVMRIIL